MMSASELRKQTESVVSNNMSELKKISFIDAIYKASAAGFFKTTYYATAEDVLAFDKYRAMGYTITPLNKDSSFYMIGW